MATDRTSGPALADRAGAVRQAVRIAAGPAGLRDRRSASEDRPMTAGDPDADGRSRPSRRARPQATSVQHIESARRRGGPRHG